MCRSINSFLLNRETWLNQDGADTMNTLMDKIRKESLTRDNKIDILISLGDDTDNPEYE